MASSAQLAIAKASFSAVLLRPDPSPCSRDEIEHFYTILGAAIDRCSPQNVQKCKQWALRHLVQSPARAASLGKYLAALASSATSEGDGRSNGQAPATKPSATRRPSTKRQRLHVLYILNDLLYHVKYRNRDDAFAKAFEAVLSDLFRSTASFSNSPKHIRKVEDLLAIWQEREYFSRDLITKLRAVVQDAPLAKASDEDGANGLANRTTTDSTSKAKNAPFVMPSMHGDATTPWYDLPAGNWLPAIQPNSTRPIDPSMVRPLQLAAGPAEKTIVDAVKKLLLDVDRIYAKDRRLDADPTIDIDQMGERVEVDEITGDVLNGDTYYGWSRAFCEKMKARRKKGPQADDGGPRGRGRSRSQGSRSPYSSSRSPSSHGGERPVFKKRRLSRSPSRGDAFNDDRSRSRQRSYSRDRYRRSSRSPPSRSRSRGGRYRRSGSRSPPYSPPPPPPAGDAAYGNHPHHPPPPPNAYFHQQQQQPPPPNFPPFPPPPHMAMGGGGGFPPVPPPPPPNYQGQHQWHPPPPPPPNMQVSPGGGGGPGQGWMPPGATPAVPWSGGWAPAGQPPPPPPPPQMGGYPPQQQQQQGYSPQYGGRGGGYGGRGGWNNGGGRGDGGSYGRGRGGGW